MSDPKVRWDVCPTCGDLYDHSCYDMHEMLPADHCSCWASDEKPCCRCGYDGDDQLVCPVEDTP